MLTRSTAVSLFVLVAGAVAACSEPAAESDAAEPVGEQSEALTLADSMVWTNPAHDVLNLIPGSDFASATDADPTGHEVYQVLVDPQPNSQNGKITVDKFWNGTTASSCSTRSMSVRAFAQVSGSSLWTEIKKVDVTSEFTNTGGEFPQQGCEATVSFSYASNVAQVRVLSQARSRIFFNGIPFNVNTAASVTAFGKTPAPQLSASIKFDPDGAANATVTNFGNVSAPQVDADIKYDYDFCPAPSSAFDSPFCILSGIDACTGSFCPPGTAWPFNGGARKAVECSWQKDFPQVTINANGGVLNWIWHQAGTQAGCGLCDPSNANCANAHTSITARMLQAPYSSMPAAISFTYADTL